MVDQRTGERPAPKRPELPVPDRVRMPLLSLVTEESLDQDYRHVADRRTAAGEAPTSDGRHRGAAVVVAVFGILIATAAVQTSRNADMDSASREALVQRIDDRKEAVSSLQDRIIELRGQNTDLAEQFLTLGDSLRGAQTRLRELQVNTGFVAVQGQGVRVTVEDAPSGEPEGRVRATDLRLLVNGLWEAGAEAIAINGRRLTALSAIVNANIAIQVNRTPLSPPYVVQAIGDIRTLQADLFNTTSGLTFQALAERYGFVVQPQNVETMSLPAAPSSQLRLRHAEAAQGEDPGNQKEESTP